MEALITAGPWMSTAEGLNEAELRDQLVSLQRRTLELTQALHHMNLIAHSQADSMAVLVDAHERGDREAIDKKMTELSNWRKDQTMPCRPH